MVNALDFTGRAVLVTGGTQGIGRAIAEGFLREGADVVVCARNAPATPPAAGKRTAAFETCDVRDADAVARLIEANPFELPPGMVEAESETLVEDLQRQLRPQQGEAAPLQVTEEVRQQLREQAITRIKRELLIEEIAKREEITVGDSDVETELKRLAERTDQRLEYIRRQMEQAGALGSIRHNILADKVLEFVAGRCTVTEVSKPPEPEPSSTQV